MDGFGNHLGTQKARRGTRTTQEASGGHGLKKRCPHRLKQTNIDIQILYYVFEGQITKHGKLQSKMRPGRVNRAAAQSRPLSETVRNLADKSVWGTSPNKVHIEMKLKA